MAWEPVKGRASGFGIEPIADDEVSIVTSRRNAEAPPSFRVNVHRNKFDAEARCLLIMVDREKQKIGFFRISEEAALANQGKKICSYGKGNSKMCYINLPKIINTMGFEKARYEILKPKEKDEKEMYFYISAKKKKEEQKK